MTFPVHPLAPSTIGLESTYKSGEAVQITGATSLIVDRLRAQRGLFTSILTRRRSFTGKACERYVLTPRESQIFGADCSSTALIIGIYTRMPRAWGDR